MILREKKQIDECVESWKIGADCWDNRKRKKNNLKLKLETTIGTLVKNPLIHIWPKTTCILFGAVWNHQNRSLAPKKRKTKHNKKTCCHASDSIKHICFVSVFGFSLLAILNEPFFSSFLKKEHVFVTAWYICILVPHLIVFSWYDLKTVENPNERKKSEMHFECANSVPV